MLFASLLKSDLDIQTVSIWVQVVKTLVNKGLLDAVEDHCQRICNLGDGSVVGFRSVRMKPIPTSAQSMTLHPFRSE
jgi:hypothetical protein